MRRCFIEVKPFDSLGIGCQDRCQVSGVRFWSVRRDAMATKDFLDVEDLEVYKNMKNIEIAIKSA